MLYELHPVVKYLMTKLEASVDKDVALVAKLERIPPATAYFLIHGTVTNNLGQTILADFFVIPMNMNGCLIEKPYPFEDFLLKYRLNEELYTLTIPDGDVQKLQQLLPSVINFAHKLHMDQKQQLLQAEMEKELAVYNEKLKNWHASKTNQLQLDFQDKVLTGFVKKRRQDKEYEIKTILDTSSQYFKDLTSLNQNPYLKVISVFYND